MINKLPYNKLLDIDKQRIIEGYFKEKGLNFKPLSDLLEVSERALSRVLKEANINTKTDYIKELRVSAKCDFIYLLIICMVIRKFIWIENIISGWI